MRHTLDGNEWGPDPGPALTVGVTCWLGFRYRFRFLWNAFDWLDNSMKLWVYFNPLYRFVCLVRPTLRSHAQNGSSRAAHVRQNRNNSSTSPESLQLDLWAENERVACTSNVSYGTQTLNVSLNSSVVHVDRMPHYPPGRLPKPTTAQLNLYALCNSLCNKHKTCVGVLHIWEW